MKVHDLMLKDLTSVEPDDTIRTLVETIESAEVSGLPVTDENGCLVGIIFEKDILTAALPKYMDLLSSTAFIPNLDQLTRGLNRIADDSVSEHMSSDVICVEQDADDLQAADLMMRHRLSLLPVVDGAGHLVGVVRRIDLFTHVL